MSEFGYIPEAPEQSFGNNKGIFTPKDIYDLTRADKYTNYGQLELIETKTVSNAVVDFTNLGNYNVHFVTFNDIVLSTDNELLGHRLSNNGGSSFISTGYQFAIQYGGTGGDFGESKNTNYSSLSTLAVTGNATNETKNGYVYYYNLLDSSKYSFCTLQTFSQYTGGAEGLFGSGVKTTAETHNAIRFLTTGVNALTSGSISLYGIKEYS